MWDVSTKKDTHLVRVRKRRSKSEHNRKADNHNIDSISSTTGSHKLPTPHQAKEQLTT